MRIYYFGFKLVIGKLFYELFGFWGVLIVYFIFVVINWILIYKVGGEIKELGKMYLFIS